MTGNIRHSLGLLVVALILGLVGWFLTRVEALQDVGGLFVLLAALLGLFALVKIALGLLRAPQRD